MASPDVLRRVVQRGQVLLNSCWRWRGTSTAPGNASPGRPRRSAPQLIPCACPVLRAALSYCCVARRLCVRFTPVEYVVQGSVSAMKALAKDVMPNSFPADADAQGTKVRAL